MTRSRQPRRIESNEPLGVSVLPWRTRRDWSVSNSHGGNALDDSAADLANARLEPFRCIQFRPIATVFELELARKVCAALGGAPVAHSGWSAARATLGLEQIPC